MKPLKDFYDYLLPELPGCAPGFLDLHLVEVAREFCQATCVWRADLDAIDLVADEDTYDIDGSETQSVVAKVIRLTVDDDVLYDAEWTRESHRDEPTYHLSPPFELNGDGTQLTFIEDETPAEASADGLVIHAALKPKFGATFLPDLLLTVHLEAFRKAVLSRLMLMPKKPWSNPELAMHYDSQAAGLAALSATNARRGNTRAPLRTRKSPF